MRTEKILISEIELNEDRTEGGKGDIESLARNMDKYGQINAVMVVDVVEDESTTYSYRIVAGRRRIAAAELLGWTEIRADIYDADEISEDSEEMIALSENAAREEMNAIDEGILYANELKKGTPVEELAALFCRNKSTVYQRAKLAQLIPEMRELYKAGNMSLHIAAMAAVLPEEAQKTVVEKFGDNYGRGIQEWEIRRVVSDVSKDFLARLGDCAQCAGCSKRTHYSDKTLFPELAETDDRCLDHECFQKKLKERIENAFTEFSEKIKGDPAVEAWDGCRIVTTVSVPDGTEILGIKISSIADEEDDITEPQDDDDARIKEQLEAAAKVEWVPCWNGTEFVFIELAKRADVDALYFDSDDEPQETWQERDKKELSDMFRAVPEEKLSKILADDNQYWSWKNKGREIFKKKLSNAVLQNKDDEKILITEQVALLLLLNSSVKTIKQVLPDAGITDEDTDYSAALYEKLLTQRRADMICALLHVACLGYYGRPTMSNLDGSDWQKIFAHLDIDLTKLRDEAAIESVEEPVNAD